MRFFVVMLLLSVSAIGQEGIPTNVGTGDLPAGLDGVTDLHVIQQSQIDALRLCVDVLRNRYERGLININNLLDAQTQLAIARLNTTHVKQERLDFIQEALANALKSWQRIHDLQKVGSRGGEADAEAQARAAVFRFRVMWLKEKAIGKIEPKPMAPPAIDQEGIPTNVGTGDLPPGLDDVTDLHAIQQSQIDALRLYVDVLRNRYERGLINISNLLDAQTKLAIARLDTTHVKQERLNFIQEALISALTTWQRINELQKVGSRGGEADAEAQARAAVFRFRVMWLKEKAIGKIEPKPMAPPAIDQEGIPTNVGTGDLPPGLDGVTDLHVVQQSHIDALRQCVDVLRNRYERGLININNLLDAQTELAIARLDTTNDRQERLDFIQEALTSALKTWQRIHTLEIKAARGGEADAETQARAAVFRYRVMWLKEKAGENTENVGFEQPPLSKDFVAQGGCTAQMDIPPTANKHRADSHLLCRSVELVRCNVSRKPAEWSPQYLRARLCVRLRAGMVWVCCRGG